MTLREDLIEAGAEALREWLPDTFGPWLAEGSTKTMLDAMLDLLTKQADEWNRLIDEADDIDSGYLETGLAVLRNPGSQP